MIDPDLKRRAVEFAAAGRAEHGAAEELPMGFILIVAQILARQLREQQQAVLELPEHRDRAA
jgi:hypothetical protein